MASTSQQPISTLSGRNFNVKTKNSTNLARDHNRIDRDRAPHVQTGASNHFNSLSDEQREEINEAVRVTLIIFFVMNDSLLKITIFRNLQRI